MFRDEKTRAEFVEDVTSTLSENYYVDLAGRPLVGQAVSYVLSSLRDRCGCKSGRVWSRLGGLGDFESTLIENGFRIVPGKNARGNRARIVAKEGAK